jgi:pyruvate dehydrogenase E1 component beta subunit/2-oxoisovalerate dehydrogenase E1 component
MAATLVASITDEACLCLEAPVERVTGYDVPVPMFAREETYLPDTVRIATVLERTVGY